MSAASQPMIGSVALGMPFGAPAISVAASSAFVAAQSSSQSIVQQNLGSQSNSNNINNSNSNSSSSTAAAMASPPAALVPTAACGQYFNQPRHLPIKAAKSEVIPWKMKQRLKTVHVALVLCLNIGVDPPDIIKCHPAAKLECWTDPFSMTVAKALDTIGANLKAQYERWQPRYIPLSIYDLYSWMDSPSIYVFDCSAAGLVVNTFVQLLQQKDREYMAQHGPNAHAPPAASNIPAMGLHAGSSSAAAVTTNSRENIILAACQANEVLPQNPKYPADLFTSCLTTPIRIALKWFYEENNKLLEGQIPFELIENIPGKIQDRRTPLGELNWIFTAVTDTIAWSVLPRELFHKLFRQDLLVASLFRNFLLADRIMRTANCTPISYPKLPPTHNHPMWQSWDLAVDQCLVQLPKLLLPAPPTQLDPLAAYQFSEFFSAQLTDFEVWLSFGGGSGLVNTLSSNGSVARLPAYDPRILGSTPTSAAAAIAIEGDSDDIVIEAPLTPTGSFRASGDFSAAAAASAASHARLGSNVAGPSIENAFADALHHMDSRQSFLHKQTKAPHQLPILLQVLLSQVHRLRALTLLGKFLDMGPWAVNMALSVGIFPYVLKLLQSNSVELKKILVFIWAKILALDPSCQFELIKDNGHMYFINVLSQPPGASSQNAGHLSGVQQPQPNPSENIAMNDLQLKSLACFVLSSVMHRFRAGQDACLAPRNVLSVCSQQLNALCDGAFDDEEHTEQDEIVLKRWLLLTMAKAIEGNEEAQEQFVAKNVHQQVAMFLADKIPEIRAAAVYCLKNLVVAKIEENERDAAEDDGADDPESPTTGAGPQIPMPSAASAAPRPPYFKSERRIVGELETGSALYRCISDGSPLVRRELVYAVAQFIKAYDENINTNLLKGIIDEFEAFNSQSTKRRNDAEGAQALATAAAQYEAAQRASSAASAAAAASSAAVRRGSSAAINAPQGATVKESKMRALASSLLPGIVKRRQSSSVPAVQQQQQQAQQQQGPASANMMRHTSALTSDENVLITEEGELDADESSATDSLSDSGDGIDGAPGGRDIGKRTFFALDMCRVILMLCNDPLPSVQNAATKVLMYLKHTVLSQYFGPSEASFTTGSSFSMGASSANLGQQGQQQQGVAGNPPSPLRIVTSSSNNLPRATLLPTASVPASMAATTAGGGGFQRSAQRALGTSLSSQSSLNIRKSQSETSISNISKRLSTSATALDLAGAASAVDDGFLLGQDLPESIFFEWSSEYFKAPILPQHTPSPVLQLQQSSYATGSSFLEGSGAASAATSASTAQQDQEEQEADEDNLQNMYEYFEKQYQISPKVLRQQRRNEKLLREAMVTHRTAGKRKLEDQIGFFGNENDIVSKMKFHPFEPLLIVSDEYDGISVWNWITAKKVNSFHCGDRLKGRITDFQILPEQHLDAASLLLVSSSSGNVCVYKNFDSAKQQRFVTAFSAVPEHICSRQDQLGMSPGILTQWQPQTGLLFVAGDMEYMKVWDMEKELCLQSIPISNGSSGSGNEIVTCLTANGNQLIGPDGYAIASDDQFNHCVTCGCSDGSVIMFDRRQNGHALVASHRAEHRTPVINVHMQRVNNYQVISGSASGDVIFWDTRVLGGPVRGFEANRGGSMTALVVHDFAPVLAMGSNNQFIKVLNTSSGETLSSIYYHDGFLGQRIGPISALAFHPYKMLLAAGSTDSIISLYSSDSNLLKPVSSRQK